MKIKENYEQIIDDLRDRINAIVVGHNIINNNIEVDEYCEGNDICFDLKLSQELDLTPYMTTIIHIFGHQNHQFRNYTYIKIKIKRKNNNKVSFLIKTILKKGIYEYKENNVECNTINYLERSIYKELNKKH